MGVLVLMLFSPDSLVVLSRNYSLVRKLTKPLLNLLAAGSLWAALRVMVFTRLPRSSVSPHNKNHATSLRCLLKTALPFGHFPFLSLDAIASAFF